MHMRVIRYLTVVIAALIVSISVYGYDRAKVDSYIREAEYYTKQAESFEREAAYYTRQAQKLCRRCGMNGRCLAG